MVLLRKLQIEISKDLVLFSFLEEQLCRACVKRICVTQARSKWDGNEGDYSHRHVEAPHTGLVFYIVFF